MAKHADIKVCVIATTDKAVLCTTDEGSDNEQDIYIPMSLIEDMNPLDNVDIDSNCTIAVEKWFLRANSIPYDSDSGWNP